MRFDILLNIVQSFCVIPFCTIVLSAYNIVIAEAKTCNASRRYCRSRRFQSFHADGQPDIRVITHSAVICTHGKRTPG